MFEEVKETLSAHDWFQKPGAYVLVDGAYGSTGKGAIAALLGAIYGDQMTLVTTNAGPNSGHTGYWPHYPFKARLQPSGVYVAELDRVRVLTQQIPVAAVIGGVTAYLNAGAIINPAILYNEAELYRFDYHNLIVNPQAAVIDPTHAHDDAESTAKIASTNKGVGRALARKVMREGNVVKNRADQFAHYSKIADMTYQYDWSRDVVFVETAQGFSLGLNQRFHPHVTSRECSVGQALADAAIPYNQVRKVIMSVRTFPIRVGNTPEGHSGDCYGDQHETSWEAIGQPVELTTVTKRVRRVFTWSSNQFMDACTVNQPDVIFLNFVQYIKDQAAQEEFIRQMVFDYETVMGRAPDAVLLGHGPFPEDVTVWRG